MPKSRAVLDADTCPRCRMLHGTEILPPHGACTAEGGCRCTAEHAPGEPMRLDLIDTRELEESFGDAVTDSLGDD